MVDNVELCDYLVKLHVIISLVGERSTVVCSGVLIGTTGEKNDKGKGRK